ncbi:cation efflux protein, partial [Vararia minispora EC-137]
PEAPMPLVLRSYLKTIMDNAESKKIFYFLMMNIAFMVVQMFYGMWTNSLGLISDAIHMAFDCMAIAVGLFASIMATWPPNERFTYGYGRIETLSGFANGIFLVLISMFIIFEAIQRLLDPPEMNTNQLLLINMEGVFSPVTPSYRFGVDDHFAAHSSAHTPNFHDHSHVHTHNHHGHHGHSDNMRGVFLHVMADTLGSVGVIISTLLIQLSGWTGFDPIASLFIAILIAASVIPLIIDTGKVLALDLSGRSGATESALSELSSIVGLVSYTMPKFWPKDSETIIGSIHIQLGSAHGMNSIVEQVDTLLRDRIPGLEELTIQVEVIDFQVVQD